MIICRAFNIFWPKAITIWKPLKIWTLKALELDSQSAIFLLRNSETNEFVLKVLKDSLVSSFGFKISLLRKKSSSLATFQATAPEINNPKTRKLWFLRKIVLKLHSNPTKVSKVSKVCPFLNNTTHYTPQDIIILGAKIWLMTKLRRKAIMQVKLFNKRTPKSSKLTNFVYNSRTDSKSNTLMERISLIIWNLIGKKPTLEL